MILLLDNFDSFTYNLVDYFNQLGVEVKVFRNDVALDKIKEYSYEGVVLSPGPENPEKAGYLMEVVNHYHDKLPMLGICLGHQAIGRYFGAQLEKAIRPMHGKITRISVSGGAIFDSIPFEMDVVRYHSLVIKELPEILESTAVSDENELMAMQHRNLPISGLQFHPEAHLTEHGMDMLANWLRFNNIAQLTTD